MPKRSRRLTRFARENRRHATRAEARIWWWLRDRKTSGAKFGRQVPIGPFIADFYCAELKLIIEMDGAQHETGDGAEYDGRRSRFFRRFGITVVRIPNEILIRDPFLAGQIIDFAVDSARRRLG